MTTSLRKKGFTLIELMIVVAIIGILSAIAIPNFIKFQARARQSEPKANLKALFVAQKAYYGERSTFSPNVIDIGFVPERGNRYAIANGGAAATWATRSTSQEAIGSGTQGFASDVYKGFTATTTLAVTNITVTAEKAGGGTCAPAADVGCVQTGDNTSFLALAAANIDNDTAIDTWCVSSMTVDIAASTVANAEAEPQHNGPGIPSNNINDVR